MWYKWTKRILAGIGILVVLIFGIATAIIFLYEDEIKKYAVDQINTHLKTEVKVGEIELTLFEQFPSASLKFNNTFIPDLNDTTEKDTMLFAESLYLNFNFWDIIDGNYKVKELQAENSVVKLKINETGSENYNIWKKDTLAESNDKFSFALEKVVFDNIRLQYKNDVTHQDYSISSEQIDFNGNFSKNVYDLNASSDLFIHRFESNSVSYISDKNASIDLVLNIDRDSSHYNINKADFLVEDLTFDISGKYSNHNDSSFLDLLVKGKNIDLETAFTIFPKEYFETLQQYDANGLLEFSTVIRGLINKESSPKVFAEFSLANGSLTEKTTGAHFTNLSFNGNFENQNKNGVESLSLEKIKGKLEGGDIEGSVKIENFVKPKVNSNLQGNLSLNQVARFVNSEDIETLSGNISFSSNFNGVFGVSEKTPIKITKSMGNIELKNASLKTKNSHINFSEIYGKFSLKKNDAAVSNLTGKILSSQFKVSGIIKNIIPFVLLDNQELTIETDFKSKSIDLNEILVSSKEQGTESTPLSFPDNINFDLKAQIGKLNYDQFHAKNLKGIITLQDKKLTAKNIRFEANKGSYIATTEIEETGVNQFAWMVDADASKIDIENFFFQLDNFGQQYLTNNNLKGRADVHISMATVLDGYMNIDMDKLYVNSSINLKKGELIEQQSMLDIADYLASNKFVKTAVDTKTLKKKLKHIKFSDLSNQIKIEKGVITIPRMTIRTNVMDLGIVGSHGFDNNVDYHLNFRLNEVLKQKKSQEEFGPVQDDGLGVKLFLHMFGNIEDLSYKLDKKERKLAKKEAIQEEKQELKSILKQEFGLFKNDTSVKKVEKEKVKPTFEVEWDEFDENNEDDPLTNDLEDLKSDQKSPEKKKNKGLNKFLKKLGIEEEEKKKVEMEIED